jgi:hypothetical protein
MHANILFMLLNENQIFWANLKKIQDLLLLDGIGFSAYIGMNHQEYSYQKDSEKFLPINAVYELSEKLNFHFEDLLKPDFSLNYSPDKKTPLAIRYDIGKHSHTRAIVNILNYVELKKGARSKINLLRKFQLAEEFIMNPENKVNYLLIADITKYLSINENFEQKNFLH